MGLPRWLADLVTVVAFLTIIPVGIPVGRRAVYRPGSLMAAAWCFPVIGLLVGVVGSVIYGLAIWLGFTPWLAATLCVGAMVLLCGGLHEDGLGDFVDGLGGHTRERRLEIMHDSQAGNFAILALLLLFAARIGAVTALEAPGRVLAAMLVAAAISRAAMVVVMYVLPNARQDGLSVGAGRPGRAVTLIAAFVAGAVSVIAVGAAQAIACIAVASFLGCLIAILVRRRLGGQTGDVLGAVCLVTELGCLLVIGL